MMIRRHEEQTNTDGRKTGDNNFLVITIFNTTFHFKFVFRFSFFVSLVYLITPFQKQLRQLVEFILRKFFDDDVLKRVAFIADLKLTVKGKEDLKERFTTTRRRHKSAASQQMTTTGEK